MSKTKSWVLLFFCVACLNLSAGRGNAEVDTYGFELEGQEPSVFDIVEQQKKELAQLRKQINKLKESQSKIVIVEKSGPKKTAEENKEVLELKNKISALEKEKDSLKADLQNKKAEAEELKVQASRLRQQSAKAVSEGNAGSELQKKIDSLQENIINFDGIVAQKDREIAQLQEQISRLKEQSKKTASKDNSSAVLKRKIDALQQSLKSSERAVMQKDNENVELKKQVSHLKGKQEAEALTKFVGEAEKIKQQKKEMDSLRRENDSLNKIIEGKTRELEALENEMSKVKSVSLEKSQDKELQQKIASLLEERESLNQTITQLKNNAGVLNDQIVALQASGQKPENFDKINKELFAELEAVSRDRELLMQTLEGQKNEANELSRQIALLQKENNSVGVVTQNNNELKNQVNSLEKKISELEKNQAVLESMSLSSMHALRQPELVNAAEKKAGRVIHINLAYAYAMEGKQKKAIDEYRKVLALDKDNEDAHYNLGWLLVKEKKYAEAAAEYKLALKGLSKDADAYYNLYVLYTTKLNDFNLADQYYQKHVESASPGKKD